MAQRTLIKTKTAGWYEDPAEEGKKVRKQDGDVIVTRAEYERMQKGGNDAQTQKVVDNAKDAAEKTILSSGKVAHGKTTTITCAKRGCSEKRVIQVQDAKQVKFCISHQKEHRNELRRQRRKAKTAK